MDKSQSRDAQRKVIAVVESDPAVRNSLAFSLEAEDFSVRAYARADDLLETAAATHVDCLIVEYRLEGISGIELIDALRLRHFDFPIVLLATHPNPAVKRQAERRKVPIVEKPLLENTLIEKLRELVSPPPKSVDETVHQV